MTKTPPVNDEKVAQKYHQIDKCDYSNSIYKSYYKRTRGKTVGNLLIFRFTQCRFGELHLRSKQSHASESFEPQTIVR